MLSKLAKQSRLVSGFYWWLVQFGFNPRATYRAFREFPRYMFQLWEYRKSASGPIVLRPSLHDREESAGAIGNEYFWQDLLVARSIHDANPARHVDVGSRIDGFVAHLATFREVEVFDIRPVSVEIPNIKFRQVDLMSELRELEAYTPSLSCLHALEHFGLGRYGDPLDPRGFSKGLASLAALLSNQGVLYLSCPSGRSRVEFNSHRIIDPMTLVADARKHHLFLQSLTVVTSEGEISAVDPTDAGLMGVASQEYVLGIYTFRKSP